MSHNSSPISSVNSGRFVCSETSASPDSPEVGFWEVIREQSAGLCPSDGQYESYAEEEQTGQNAFMR